MGLNNFTNRYYFNPPEFQPKTVEEAKAYGDQKSESLKAWKRSGHRSIYSRLLKSGYFGSLAEIMQARFDVVVGILSLENSL